ncbi:hypothetical protein BSU04_42485 [Caballeronia sordidicola]|uniref:Uncharacterized protein n=1 Tax=Caballeronia sordidicola TaxID=196367 RepID=A0A226WM77_CABSO|nr:hypothetical protein BSU04_42485 [Caballeronia sordidicola]
MQPDRRKPHQAALEVFMARADRPPASVAAGLPCMSYPGA